MAIKNVLTLLSNVAAAGNGPNVVVGPGGTFVYMICGTFTGTSSKMQILGPDGSTFIDVAGSTLSAAGFVTVSIPAGSTVRAVLTGGTPTAMYASLSQVSGQGV